MFRIIASAGVAPSSTPHARTAGRSKRTIGRASFAALALVVVAAAGCSSSNTSQPGGSAAAAGGTSSGATGTPIRIGAIGSYSGAFGGLLGIAKPTIQAWADAVNAAGGIAGHPIKMYIVDDQGSVPTSLTLMKQLVQVDHVVAVVGQAADGGDVAWRSYVEQAGIPIVGGENSELPYLTSPDFFDPLGNFVAEFYGLAAVARTDGPKFGAVYCAESPACAQVVPLLSGLGKSPGAQIDLAFATKVAASSPDYTSACQALKASGVQSYTLAVSTDVQKRLVAQCVQQGVTARIVDDVPDATFTSMPAFNGMQIVTSSFPFWATSTPATREFHDALTKYAPQIGSSAMPLNYIAADVWTAGKLFEAAVKASGSTTVTSASILKGLHALKNETLGGLTAPLNFAAGKANLNNSYFEYEIRGGKFAAPKGINPIPVPAGPVNAVIASLK